jgi:xanthine dehydrogenase accessory factor
VQQTPAADRELVVPAWAAVSREAAPFALLAEGARLGIPGALVAISAIDGGAPKELGAHLAVLADGRHVGHVSGGCVEPAIATEVLPFIAEGGDRIVRFGKGSPYMDIRFPCGGGVDLLVHVSPDAQLIDAALDALGRREAFAIAFRPEDSTARLIHDNGATGWREGAFVRRYLPRTRLGLAGRGPDLEVLARVALAAELEVAVATPDDASAAVVAALGLPVTRLTSPSQTLDLAIDPWTATVLLFHEHEWEDAILTQAVAAPGFYIGAMGSVRTHRQRCERLIARGVPPEQVDRIRGPIGLIDRARDPGTLALSVLAEITAERAAIDRA